MKTTQKTCPVCKSDFSIPSWRKSQKYCSRKCANAPGETAPRWKGGMVTLTCQHCGKDFQVGRSREQAAKFCSRSCAVSSKVGENALHWKGGDVMKTCANCGKSFSVKKARVSVAKYCSTECHSKAKTGVFPEQLRVTAKVSVRNCEFCNTPMTITTKRPAKRFCSQKCASKFREQEGLVERTCQYCQKTFTVHHWRDDACCSKSCATSMRRGEKASNWRGGISFEPYPPGFTIDLRKKIRERDSYTCAVCGSYGRCVHHIDYVKENIKPENLITLCASCHSKTNSKREYWKEYFHKLLSTSY